MTCLAGDHQENSKERTRIINHYVQELCILSTCRNPSYILHYIVPCLTGLKRLVWRADPPPDLLLHVRKLSSLEEISLNWYSYYDLLPPLELTWPLKRLNWDICVSCVFPNVSILDQILAAKGPELESLSIRIDRDIRLETCFSKLSSLRIYGSKVKRIGLHSGHDVWKQTPMLSHLEIRCDECIYPDTMDHLFLTIPSLKSLIWIPMCMTDTPALFIDRNRQISSLVTQGLGRAPTIELLELASTLQQLSIGLGKCGATRQNDEDRPGINLCLKKMKNLVGVKDLHIDFPHGIVVQQDIVPEPFSPLKLTKLAFTGGDSKQQPTIKKLRKRAGKFFEKISTLEWILLCGMQFFRSGREEPVQKGDTDPRRMMNFPDPGWQERRKRPVMFAEDL